MGQIGYNVNNYAVDESCLNNIINGIIPQNVYQKDRSYPYPQHKDGKLYYYQIKVI